MKRVLLVGLEESSFLSSLLLELGQKDLATDIQWQDDVVSALSVLGGQSFSLIVIGATCFFSKDDALAPGSGTDFARLLIRRIPDSHIALVVENAMASYSDDIQNLLIAEATDDRNAKAIARLLSAPDESGSALQELCVLRDGMVVFEQGSDDVELREDLLDFLRLKAKEIGSAFGVSEESWTLKALDGSTSVACVATGDGSVFARFGVGHELALGQFNDDATGVLEEAGFAR